MATLRVLIRNSRLSTVYVSGTELPSTSPSPNPQYALMTISLGSLVTGLAVNATAEGIRSDELLHENGQIHLVRIWLPERLR